MLELLSSRSKGDPDSVGALHEAARRFCYRNVKSMLDYYGSGDSHKRASRNGEGKSALWNAVGYLDLDLNCIPHIGKLPCVINAFRDSQ